MQTRAHRITSQLRSQRANTPAQSQRSYGGRELADRDVEVNHRTKSGGDQAKRGGGISGRIEMAVHCESAEPSHHCGGEQSCGASTTGGGAITAPVETHRVANP
ncbi:MAG: hypothetical protein RIC12_01740 [Pirellulales bacterium]